MTAWINVRLAQSDSRVSWYDKFYFLKFLRAVHFRQELQSYLCRLTQPLTTACQCTVDNALDFDNLGPWLGIKLLNVFLLIHKLFIPSSNPARGIFFDL